MRILFVNNFAFPDYQKDMVYHGLIDSGHDVYETDYPRYMLSNYPNPTSLYGRGFSIFAKLNHTPKVESRDEIIQKILGRYYDCVIFGSVWRDLSYIEEVLKSYSRDRVYFIDGEDETNILHELTSKGVYYKRECIDSSVKPITFAIPESQLISHPVEKTKLFGTIIPGHVDTYIFHNESDYYKDYATSYYGITHKKAGWDCMRHYEILANKCIPYFSDLAQCPPTTMCTFPKEIILESNQYASKNEVHPNYNKLNEELFDYTTNNLTTKKLIERILC